MVKTRNAAFYTVVFFLVSFFLHAILFYAFTPVIDVEHVPVIVCWPEILRYEDLFSSQKKSFLPLWVRFPMRKFDSLQSKVPVSLGQGAVFKEDVTTREKEAKEYLFLWESPPYLREGSHYRNETLRCKIYLSEKGKSLLVFPTELPSSISVNNYTKNYLRQAVMSLDDRFSWTDTELVIK